MFFGLVVAAYSFGHLVSAPFFDWWRQRSRALRPILLVCLLLMLLGHAIYLTAGALPVGSRKWAILASRAIVGSGECEYLFTSYKKVQNLI